MDYQNAWNNFQKEQKGKLKGSKVADKQKLRDIWIAMPKEEKEKYGLKHEKNDGPRITIQCSATEFVNRWNSLGEERCRNLKNNLKDNPFKNLLEMDGRVRSTDLILYLVSNFNITNNSLHINGCDYIVTPEDFTLIMGIKDGGEEVDLKHDPSEELKKMFIDEKACQLQICNKKVFQRLKNDDTNIANRAYALFSMIHIVCAPGRGILNGKYLNNIENMKNKNWATHAINTLVSGITSFKQGKGRKQNRLGGCVLFLQLFYMSKSWMTPPPKDIRLLEYVKKYTVEEFLTKHKTLFKEREDAKLNERGVGHGEKIPKKQKVMDEEDIANSLKSKYKEFEEELEFYGKLFPHNETYKELKNKMRIYLCAERCFKEKESAPTTTDPISLETSQIDATTNNVQDVSSSGSSQIEMWVSSPRPDAGSSLIVYTRKEQKSRGKKERQPGFEVLTTLL